MLRYCFVVVLALAATVPVVTAREPSGFSLQAFEALGAVPMKCPTVVLDMLEDHQAVDCATLEGSFAEFKKAWQRFVVEEESYSPEPLGGWKKSGAAWKTRSYRLGGTPLSVAFSELNRGLMLTYDRATSICDEGSIEEARLPFGGTEGVTMPRLVHSEGSPAMPMDAGTLANVREGQVVLKIKINEHGVPTVLCVLEEHPVGRGFGDAAKASVRRWRYKPARKGGEPVEVALLVTVNW